ncbi:hypothetical protein A3I27_04450 [Candidatus Giovannonibacteria bacterium RIFCSPLOWO2_02_FULL_43_11b]|uniref:Uncharacterized protein n=1 Tax=Candidatus Giovannonibacteria bacterium RIFCSPHIGHO2_12_FULL_43_15 TaxID=1798341 RepID=A0A1F5WPF2_9BACT|nr:MAG: hypothetical protein A2739_00810 [Candidatus Giovannonibacteria bacterium RIFCSPHIGHO2_01_FULL_43_100]OGF66739.1 MAG: hypothetical protein A3B97_02390 [Candidatus Giovannonibacteria bacterium RIFCSPHIGHO2_02_FULL_43_32]OGF77515.1 MAG: hypothetical protein A3F23_00885 [Candidatus Giovannonibacteria bacterium RIFCSPHIGHO2_12_FULL_43_15]OGF78886.1 MAG: hypothetical protein A3A15_00285 [Candidatus Giovannonibacteria bacterium RIFCSPLOWO2_01_FULL_43_60]OGF89959.1 MAG: hypothetical protein A3
MPIINTYRNEDLLKTYQKLPFDLQEIILSKNKVAFLQSLCEKYNLSGIKARDLKDAATFVLLGWTHPKDFIPDLSEKLGVDRETAKKIAEDVNREIFQKVRVSLRKLYGITDEAPPSLEATEGAVKITENVPAPKPPAPKPPPLPTHPSPKATEGTAKPPPKIVIKENIEIPKEAPKEELKPLEIRPIKGGPLGESEMPNEKTPTPSRVGAPTASVGVSPRPQVEMDMGLKVMPHSQKEVGIKKEVPKPPSGMAFMNEKKPEQKPPEPPKPSYDQYRERI